MRKHVVVAGLALVALALVASCATTQLVSHWKEPTYTGGPLQDVLVIAVAQNDAVRRVAESEFVNGFNKQKVQAVPSYSFGGQAMELTLEAVEAYVGEKNLKSVIVTRLVDQKTVTEYVPPTTTTSYMGPYPSYYYGWYDYYHTSYATVSTPGYTYERQFINLETNVYDVASRKLVWSGLTETELTGDVQAQVREFTSVIMMQLKQDKLL